MGRPYSDVELAKILKDPVLFQDKLCNRPPVSETQIKILRSNAKRICIAAGRRWSKTTMFGSYTLWYSLNHEKVKTAFFAPSWEQVDIYMDITRELIDEFPDYLKNRISITTNRKRKIVIEGSTIIARSATSTSMGIRGHGADLVIRDEDAFIPDGKMKEIRPLLLKMGKRAKISKELVGSTPLGHNHFWKDFNSKLYESYQVPTWDNKFYDKKLIDDEKQLMTEAEFNQEYGAQFLDDKYSAFPQKLIDLAITGRRLIQYPNPDYEYVAGIDLGKRRDASVIYIMHAEANHIYVDSITEIRNDFSGKFWTKMLNTAFELIKRFRCSVVCIDQTSIGDMPSEELINMAAEQNLSCNVRGIDFTRRLKNSRQGIISQLQLKFERGEIHFPFYAKLIRELKNVRFEASQSPNAKLETYGRYVHIGHDDHVIAMALGLLALPQTNEIFYTGSNPIEKNYDEPLPMLQVTNKFFDGEA